MRYLRPFIVLVFICILIVGLMPAAFAAECPDSPNGNHEWVSAWEGTWIDSCTLEGWNWQVCWWCGATTDKVWAVELFHTWSEWETVKEATCSSTGTLIRTCGDCNQTETMNIPMAAHTFDDLTVVVQATDHSSGTKSHTCTVCGYTEEVPYDPEGTLRRGDNGSAVRALQQQLIDQGYLNKEGADGNFGQITEKAVKSFQSAVGLTPDGVAWPQTTARLNHDFSDWTVISPLTDFSRGEHQRTCKDCGLVETEITWPDGTLKRDDSGDVVLALQKKLKDLGYNVGTPDGFFGAKTEQAVMDYETANSITPDGIAWPGLMNMMGIPGYEDATSTPEQAKAETEGPAPSDQTEGCARSISILENGTIEVAAVFCTQHAPLASAADAMPSQARVTMWASALESEYDAFLKQAATDGDKAIIQSERASFGEWLNAHEAYLRLVHPDDEDAVNTALADQLLRHCQTLCGLRHPGFTLGSGQTVMFDTSPSAPDRCLYEETAVENGSVSHIILCGVHRAIANASAVMPAAQSRIIWRASQDGMFNGAPIASDPGNHDIITAELGTFERWLDAYGALITYALPDDPEAASTMQEEALMEYTIGLCGDIAS